MNEVTVIKEENVQKLMKALGERTELIYDFEKINGRVLLECARRAGQEDKTMLIPNLSMVYQAMVGAKATGLKYDEVLNLSGADFNGLTLRVMRFLNGLESENYD